MQVMDLIQFIVKALAVYAAIIFVPALFFKWTIKNYSWGQSILSSVFSIFLPILIFGNNYYEINRVVDMGALWGLPNLVVFSSVSWALTLGSVAASWGAVIMLIQGPAKKIGRTIFGFMCLSAFLGLIGQFAVSSVLYDSPMDLSLANSVFLSVVVITLFFSSVYFVFSDKMRTMYWS